MKNFLVFSAVGVGCILLLFLALLLFRQNQGKCRKFLTDRLGDFIWGYFLRVWTISYIKILVGCVLSIGTVTHRQIPEKGCGIM